MSAQVTILQLPSAGAITGAEAVPIVQNGVTVQTTTAALAGSPVQTYSYLTVTQTPQLANSRYVGVTNGLAITDGGAQGLFNISTTGALLSLVNSGTGFQVKTSSTALTNRSIAVSGAGLSIADGSGVSGDPTIALSGQTLNFANASFNGLVVLSTTGAITSATITGTTSQIDVANGTGVGGNPTISLANDPVIPGTGGIAVPAGTTGQRGASVNGNLRYNSTTATFEGYANGAWGTIPSGVGVNSISFGTTGLTPATATTGAVTVAGTLAVANGGTGITSFGTGIATFLGTPSSANLRAALTDETGTGVAVFGTSPAITTSLTTASTTFALLDTAATTINFGGAATTVNIGAATGTMTVANTTLAAKAITASTTLGVTGVSTLTGGAVIQGMTVGLGAGAQSNNTAIGVSALSSITTGNSNTGVGWNACATVAVTGHNTGIGNEALKLNLTGSQNTAVGSGAFAVNTSGSSNTGLGYVAGLNCTGATNTFLGYFSGAGVTTGSNNVILGSYQGSAAPISGSGSNYIVLSDGAGTVRQTIDPSGNVSFTGGITSRVVVIADATSITVNTDTTDIATQANTQAVGTLTINAPTGTAVNGQKFILRLTSTNVQTFSFNAIFAGSTDLTLPTVSSGASKTDYMGWIYNSTAAKWQMVAKVFGF